MDSRIYWELNVQAAGGQLYGFGDGGDFANSGFKSNGVTRFFKEQIMENQLRFCGKSNTKFGACAFFRHGHSAHSGLAVLVFDRPSNASKKTYVECLILIQRRIKEWIANKKQ